MIPDLTEDVRADAQRLLDAIPYLIASCDRDTRYTRVNRAYASRFGKTPNELVGRTMAETVGPDVFNAIDPLIRRVLAGEVVNTEMTVTYPDIGPQTFQSTLTPVRNRIGDVIGWDGFGENVTQRVRFQELADSLPQIVWSVNAAGIIDYYNEQWYARTGTSEPHEADPFSFVHPEDRAIIEPGWRAAFKAGESYSAEFRMRFPREATYRWYLGRAVPVRDDAGIVVRWYGTSTDIDDQKRVEQDLEKADRQKDEFLGMLGHELRNSLTPVTFAIELLTRRIEDPATKRPLDIASRQMARIARLVDDLLDVARVAQGKMDLRREPVDVTTVVRQAVDVASELAQKRRHTIDLRAADNLTVTGDPHRLGQIFENLITNAIKYTPEGGRIHVDVARRDRQAVIAVRDNGVGIPPEVLPRIFELFVQADDSIARSDGGLGIGLTLVDRLARLHGGSVTATSDGIGQGAEFVVRLPLED